MANVPQIFNIGIGLSNETAAPTVFNGLFYFDSVRNSFRFYTNGAWVDATSQSAITTDANLSSTHFTADVVSSSFIRLSGQTTVREIVGITASTAGKQILVANASTSSLIIKNASGTEGTAANRILTDTGNDVVLAAGKIATFIYDSTSSRWRLLNAGSGSGATGGLNPTANNTTSYNVSVGSIVYYARKIDLAAQISGVTANVSSNGLWYVYLDIEAVATNSYVITSAHLFNSQTAPESGSINLQKYLPRGTYTVTAGAIDSSLFTVYPTNAFGDILGTMPMTEKSAVQSITSATTGSFSHGLSSAPNAFEISFFDNALSKTTPVSESSIITNYTATSVFWSSTSLTFAAGDILKITAINLLDTNTVISMPTNNFTSALYTDNSVTTVAHNLGVNVKHVIMVENDITAVKKRSLAIGFSPLKNWDDTNFYIDWTGYLPTSTLTYQIQASSINVLPAAVPLVSPIGNVRASSSTAQTLLSSENDIQIFTPTASHDVNLPSTSVKAGRAFFITNLGGFALTIKSSNGNTVIAASTGTVTKGYYVVRALQDTPTTSAHWFIEDVKEEGTWLPAIRLGTTTTAGTGSTAGFYLKNMRQVFVGGYLTVATTAGTGAAAIAGLPYTVNNTNQDSGAGCIFGTWAGTSGFNSPAGDATSNTDRIEIILSGATGSTLAQHTNLPNGFALYFSCTYRSSN